MIKKSKKKLTNLSVPKSPARAASSLRFTPTAWAKLLFLRDFGDTEVGGFGVTAPDDLLLVEDFRLVQQTCSWAHVAFDDASVADFFDQQVDEGRQPEQFGRIWLHTHPGDCPRPSSTDEATFDRVFGHSHWALMFILAQAGQSHARLRFNVGPGSDLEILVGIEYAHFFDGCDPEAWEQEYLENVQSEQPFTAKSPVVEPVVASPFDEELTEDWYESWLDYTEDEDSLKGSIV